MKKERDICKDASCIVEAFLGGAGQQPRLRFNLQKMFPYGSLMDSCNPLRMGSSR